MADNDLGELRERIRQLDLELVERAAERVELAREVGKLKRRNRQSTVDYAQERVVLERGRSAAEVRGLDPRVADHLFTGLIRASVAVQDEDSLRLSALGAGKNAVVVGGAGRMGRWLCRFLAAQGYTTGALDPAAPPDENDWAKEALHSAELIVCSTPPSATARLYGRFAASPPAGVVVDIASVKTPLIRPIHNLRQAGGRVASIHPMFGPSAVLLRDADVVICETGDAEAALAVEKLFKPTTANLVYLPLEDHDRIMADLLSLAHATAIAFALALPQTGHPVHSTTFQALESLAGALMRESPEVYYEIQTGNDHSLEAIERLRLALDRIVSAVEGQDLEGFRELFTEGQSRTSEQG